jgi:hypothetical protein
MPASKGPSYEANPKHKLPWQPGRKGTLCPSWSHSQAPKLLEDSVQSSKGNRRYATLNGVAFCGHEHSSGKWHGHPIGWEEVPPNVWKLWVKEGKITRKQVQDSWKEAKRSGDE